MEILATDIIEPDDPSKLDTPRILKRDAKPKEGKWICVCSHQAEGRFCSNCGRAKPLNN